MTDKYVALMELDRRTGKYGVVVPDVPGFSTVGDSYASAVRNAAEGLAGHIEVMEEYGETTAPPRTIEEIRAEWPEWKEWSRETGGGIIAMIPVATGLTVT
jgi:predicted RNase H-like HicB family nuclease